MEVVAEMEIDSLLKLNVSQAAQAEASRLLIAEVR
jgi:hypothetical protein